MSPAPPGAAFFELVRADPGRSLEAACDALVALPASLVSCSGLSLPTLSAAVSSVLAESGAAQQAGPLDYMKEAANAVDPAVTAHYLGRALEAAGVAAALAALEATPAEPSSTSDECPASPRPPLRTLLSGPAGPGPILAAVRASLGAFGDAFAARAAAVGAASSGSMGGGGTAGGSSACCPATPSPPTFAVGRAGRAGGARASTDDDACSTPPPLPPTSRAAAVEEVRARLHALAASPDGPHPRTPGRVRTRLPEQPGAPAWS